jgi:predicted N-formylglutamate amidohydrolase
MTRTRVLITCEHGGNRIPAAYRSYFRGHEQLLESHRGHDPGALALARDLAAACRGKLVYSTTSRLLVELNRSPGHPQLYSSITRTLSAEQKRDLYTRYYLPYRTAVEKFVIEALRGCDRVIHLSSHSFTPVLDGHVRHADVGLLYDPSRAGEVRLCLALQAALREAAPGLVVRRNYPYRGDADGLTTHLRRRIGSGRYVGIELEVNQKHTVGDARRWAALRRVISVSYRSTLTRIG